MLQELEPLIDKALTNSTTEEECDALNATLRKGIYALGEGKLRAVSVATDENSYEVNLAVKRLILAYFKTGKIEPVNPDRLSDGYDKIRLRFGNNDRTYLDDRGIRIVAGAIIREGSYIGQNTVFMPCFVNIGAYIDEGTMIDTWATVGSCAQIGKRVHLSGGAGIGGVLEPINARPVVIEDDVFIGARSEVVEGVIVKRGAVLSMGVFISASTPIIDANSGETWTGIVPENAVVVPGTRHRDKSNFSTYAAIIIKYADERTRSKLRLDDTFRGNVLNKHS